MRRSVARLRGPTAESALPNACVSRRFTSTKTIVAPSRQTKSISPPGMRTLRRTMLYPVDSKNAAARFSPSRPFALRSNAKCRFRFVQRKSEGELRFAHAPPARAVVAARAVLLERAQMLGRSVPLVIGKAVARFDLVQLAQQLIAMDLGDDRGGRDNRAARVAFDERLLGAGERLDAHGVRDE